MVKSRIERGNGVSPDTHFTQIILEKKVDGITRHLLYNIPPTLNTLNKFTRNYHFSVS